MTGMIEIDRLRLEDRAAWELLARGYKAFYQDPEPDEAYEATWRRLADGTELHAFGARLDGRLIGLAHYFFHPTFWSMYALAIIFATDAARAPSVLSKLMSTSRLFSSKATPLSTTNPPPSIASTAMKDSAK